MTLGKPGISGDGEYEFNQPSDVLVAPNGDIFVADGHGATGNNRIIKFIIFLSFFPFCKIIE